VWDGGWDVDWSEEKVVFEDRDAVSIFDNLGTGAISRPLADTRSPIREKVTDPG